MSRILVVDDSDAVLDFVSQTLTAARHDVSMCSSAVGLEDRLRSSKPDLLILDIVLPDRDGFQALRALRKDADFSKIPVLMISSKAEETDVEWGKIQGASEYLTKPFSAEQLLAAVSRCV